MPTSSHGSREKEFRAGMSDTTHSLHHATRKRFDRVVTKLLAWHPVNKPQYAWRALRRTPYEVLVSEFMLQQTGARQIEKKLPVFLKLFPTAKRLAQAPRSTVIRAWQGLGYNRRAINLQNAAQAIAARRTFPKTLEGLLALPGVGEYTASAVLAFAFNVDVPVVDVNVQRVLSRLWKPMEDAHAKLPVREIAELDRTILPPGTSANLHEALMDLGSTVCTKQKPRCAECPVRGDCPSAKNLHGIRHQPKPKRNIEERFFGHPRRIWRGRILKLISEAEGITAMELDRVLREDYPTILKNVLDTREFQELQKAILVSLHAEGFIAIRNGRITLTHE